MCLYQPDSINFRLIKNVVMETRVKVVFVATDKDPMMKEISEHLKNWKVIAVTFLVSRCGPSLSIYLHYTVS